ncbi:F-box only protein 6 [Camellia lanceoleosa]|uniref:F-box only protein 6 n=1 Tax=Camellia lanceoleosa TaxID=1840588 RepID=A0ACC0HYU3_9ERIC|nr:F-box only protein 6 [Camellia lanceoleosa]
MEELVMLRQFILELYGSSPYYPQPPPPSHHHHHHRSLSLSLSLSLSVSMSIYLFMYLCCYFCIKMEQILLCCFFNLDDNSAEDGCYSFTIRPEKPGTFKMLEPSKPPHAKKSRKERNLGRLADATSSTEIMEHQIWKEFPEDLYEAVIARLPIATFFRSVCKKWNSLTTSHSFSQQCARVPQAQPWFYTITHENVNTGAMYDPSSKKWHHPTNPALPTKSFFVSNPLTQSFKELPARSVKVWSRVAVGMTLNEDSTSGGYKILWVGCDGEFEVYDSIKNSWARPGNMPSTIKLPLSLNFKSQAVSIDGTLYFMRTDPDGIVSYNMVTGLWKQFVIPSPLHLSDHALAECGGQIILVGLLTKNAAMCVCIWELQKMTLLWKEVDRMPNIWCLEFYGKHMNRLVSYDVSSKEWLKVPGCTLPRGRKRQWIACGTAFHPCLTASA